MAGMGEPSITAQAQPAPAPSEHGIVAGRPPRIELASEGFARLATATLSDGRTLLDLASEVVHTGGPLRLRDAPLAVHDRASTWDVTITLVDPAHDRVLVVLHDTSDRVRLEATLRAHDAELSATALRNRRIFESNILGIFVFETPDARLLEANARFHEMLGYGPGELPEGTTLVDLTPPDHRDRHVEAQREIHGPRGASRPFEKEFLRKDGSRVPVLVGSALLGAPRAGHGHAVGFALDRTDLLEAESARSRAEALVAVAVEHAPIVLTLFDGEARLVTLAGAYAERIAGGREQLGSRVEVAFREGRAAERVRAVLGGASLPPALWHEGGHTFESRLIPLRDATGAILGAVGIGIDVTDRERAAEERETTAARLGHAQKLESLGVLAGGIAHDFNNLLTGILGNATLLARRNRTLASKELDDIISAAERAAELTRQMLAYAGRGRMRVEPVDLAREIEPIVGLVRASASKKVEISTQLASDLPPVLADAAQVQQIVMNLVMNAAEAIGDHVGHVWVSTRVVDLDGPFTDPAHGFEPPPPGRYVSLVVRDDGCGMTAAQRARIFEPFYTTKFTGRGLGLAAVLGATRGHGGAIRVESEPGAGTTFEVLFRIAPVVERRAEPARGPATQGSGGLVLVVDDEPIVRSMTQRALESSGYRTLAAGNGREAIEAFRAHAAEIRCVVLDLTMPVLGGREALREIRTLRPDVPVVLTSGYDEAETARAEPHTKFVQKPFDVDRLCEWIEAAGKAAT
jgi:PAS domain S-box-containing protein